MQYCSLKHQTLLSPPDTATNKYRFHLGPATSFFLKLLVTALCSSPVVYWTRSDLGGSSSRFIPFCLYILSMGFLQKEYWVAISSSSGSCWVWILHYDPSSVLGGPAQLHWATQAPFSPQGFDPWRVSGVILWFITRNTYCLVLIPGTEFLKALEFPKWKEL